jgi:hypothetical protein
MPIPNAPMRAALLAGLIIAGFAGGGMVGLAPAHAQTSSSTTTTTITPPPVMIVPPVVAPPAGTLSESRTERSVNPDGSRTTREQTNYRDGSGVTSNSVTTTVPPPATTTERTTTTTTRQ